MVTFQDLLIALRTLGDGCPSLELVQWRTSDPNDYAMLTPYIDGVIQARFPPPPKPVHRRPPTPLEKSRAVPARVRRHLAHRLLPPPPPTPPETPDETLRKSGVDCSFSVVIENRRDLSVPLLIWIYDLQHHHLPQLISQDEYSQRDTIIARESERATRLVTQSTSVSQDLEQFFPVARGKAKPLLWVAHVPPSAYELDPLTIVARYNLPEKFFYLPNQFWTHKNHTLVIQALDLLRVRNIRPVVVCTGSPYDHRDPDAFGRLLQELAILYLRDQFLILGTVPYQDVLALMRQSVAVMNPSLFEGFGLSAAEAKSLGKRTLLSNLPSMLEQDPPFSLFHDPNDPRELADKMELLWQTVPPGPDPEMELQARAALPGRQNEFACAFLEIAREAIQVFKTPPLKAQSNV